MKNRRMKFSKASSNVQPFRVMEILARARQLESEGRDIVHMEIGEPVFPTPPYLLKAATQLIQTSPMGYTPAAGLPDLRQRLAQYYQDRYGVPLDPRRIFVTPGASGALSLVLALIVNSGDEVLVADPSYPCYPNFLAVSGARCVRVPVLHSEHCALNAEQVGAFWTAKSRGVILASPANPTGGILPRATMKDLLSFVEDRAGFVISDEIYHGLEYQGQATTALELSSEAFVINSFSKYFGMTGWRLGWAVVPEAAISAAERLAQNLFISAPTLSQRLALLAFETENLQELETRRVLLGERRRLMLDGLQSLNWRPRGQPDGAFYVYADVSEGPGDSARLAHRLLEEEGVAVTPGFDFGNIEAATHLRLSYTADPQQITEGFQRIARFLSRFR